MTNEPKEKRWGIYLANGFSGGVPYLVESVPVKVVNYTMEKLVSDLKAKNSEIDEIEERAEAYANADTVNGTRWGAIKTAYAAGIREGLKMALPG